MSGKSELLIFDEVKPQVVVNSASIIDVVPTVSLSDVENRIEFLIHGSENEYLDLNDTFLYIQYSVKQADGRNALDDTSKAIPCRFFMNSMFSDVTLALNDVVVEGGNQLYPYKSTLETILVLIGKQSR